MIEPVHPIAREEVPTKPPQFSGDPRAFRVEDGWLFGNNHGEFGGSLEWYSIDGRESYSISTEENVNGFIRAGGSLFVYEGLAHLSLNQGTIKVVKRNATGRWVIEPFVTLHEEPCVALLDTDDTMLIVTWSSVVKVWPSGKMKLLWRGERLTDLGIFYPFWIYANSAVLDKDDTLYMGTRQEVVRIVSLHKNPRIEHIRRGTKAQGDVETAKSKFFADYANDMKSKDPLVRRRAVRRMGGTGKRDDAADAVELGREYESTFTGTNRYHAAEAAIPALKDESAAVRVEAAQALGTLGHLVGAGPLAEAMDDPSGDVAVAAASALGRLADGSLPGLIEGLKSANAAVVVESCRSLGGLGGRASIALPALRDALRHDRRDVRAAADEAIKQIAASATPHVATLNDPRSDKAARRSATWELSKIGAVTEQVIPALAQALRDPDAEVRSDAACALEYIKYIDPSAAEEAATALVETFSDESEDVAAVAVEAAARFGPAGIPKLIAVMRSDSPVLRMRAADAIFWMEHPAKEAVPDLVSLLGDKVPGVRQRAARALQHMGREAAPATSRLIELMNDPDEKVRYRVICALGGIGSTNEEVLPALNRAIHAADADTRSAAFWALRTMRPRTPAVESALVEAIADHDEFVQKLDAAELGELGRSLPMVIPALVRVAEKNLSWEVASGFGAIGPDAAAAVPLLIKGLKSTDAEVRLAAARSLGQIGPGAAGAIPALSEMAESRDLRLIIEADYALTRIRDPARTGAERR